LWRLYNNGAVIATTVTKTEQRNRFIVIKNGWYNHEYDSLTNALEKNNYDFYIRSHPQAKVPFRLNDLIEIKRVKA
jgi:hypothetical protein